MQNSGTSSFLFYGCFADSQNAWATGFGGALIHTTDGCETWTSRVSGSNRVLHDVFFIDENTGWIVCGDRGNYPSFILHRLILHTTDGTDYRDPEDPGTGVKPPVIAFDVFPDPATVQLYLNPLGWGVHFVLVECGTKSETRKFIISR